MNDTVSYLALLGFITLHTLLCFADSSGGNGCWQSRSWASGCFPLSFSASLRGQCVFASKLLRLTFPKNPKFVSERDVRIEAPGYDRISLGPTTADPS